MNPEVVLNIRAKKLGVLIRDAREASGKTKKESAELLGISPGAFNSLEDGTTSPSLPELELLAYLYQVPLSHFWEDELKTTSPTLVDDIAIERNFELRDRSIGRILSEARDHNPYTLAEIKDHTGISDTRLRKFESGESGIPVPELEALLRLYDIPRQDLIDRDSRIGNWVLEQDTLDDFRLLDLDTQEFVSKPVNQPYLRIAKRLSKMSAEDLRQIAEILLEITI
jgi:transcriptional regulator with XRE-family HTH domain